MAYTCDNCEQPSEAPQAGGAGALPGEAEVEAALDLISTISIVIGTVPGAKLHGALEKIRAHLHHLSAENARLRANGAAKLSTIHALCDDEERLKRQARLDALRWAKQRAYAPGGISNLEAEIARLESLLAGEGEGK